MKANKRGIYLFLALAFFGGLAIDGAAQKAKKRGEAAMDLERSFIRKELLVPKKGEIPPPSRDIFSPRASFAPNVPLTPTGTIPPPGNSEQPPDEGSSVPPAPPEPQINLAYVGFVRSPAKMIALVLYEGQPMAVAEGEEIVPGFKIEKVGTSQLDIIGPDSKRKSFSRQGE
jgi:hypothetical protein